MIKISISTPAYGEIFYAPYVQSLFRLVRAFEQRRWTSLFASIAYADVVESRNFLLTHWFDKTDASHLLFIDADMGFDAQVVIDMLLLDKPLTGVVYPKRQVDLERLAKLAAAKEPPVRALARSHEYIVRRNARSGTVDRKGFIEVDGCGAGILLIKRSCIETMMKKFPDLSDNNAKKTSPLAKNLDRLIRAFDPILLDGARLSEDYSFCHRWRQCGGEVWANVTHEITHVGLHRFKGRYSDARGGPRISVVTTAPGAAATGPKVVTGRIGEAARKRPGGPKIATTVIPAERMVRVSEKAKKE